MKEVLDFVKRPPLAMEFATKGEQVMKASLNQKVLRLMEVMDKNGYSHIPVMRDGQFCGVFSVGSVFRYLLRLSLIHIFLGETVSIAAAVLTAGIAILVMGIRRKVELVPVILLSVSLAFSLYAWAYHIQAEPFEVLDQTKARIHATVLELSLIHI